MAGQSTKPSLTALTVGGLSDLAQASKVQATVTTPGIAPVLIALREFDACVRYLNTRRSAGAVFNIENEADVQDVLYILLRPWIVDLSYESPGEKSGNRYTIKDFISSSGRFVIDAKYIRDKDHGRLISKELHDDIEMYRTNPRCDHIVFFVYDPSAFIPDQRALREAIEIDRAYGPNGERKISCHLIVKP
jgi:hypothetical protein